jgi:hypothetical protein
MYSIDKTPRPIRPLDPLRLDWEEEVTQIIEEDAELDRSDAQGFLMCRQDALDYCYEDGMTPEMAAEYLLTEEEGFL